MADPIVSIEPQETVLVATVQAQQLNEELTRQLQTELAAAAENLPELPLILDMANVEYMPSLSLGALVELQRDHKKSGRRLILTSLQTEIRSTLSVTRLDKLFEICDSVEEARAQVQG